MLAGRNYGWPLVSYGCPYTFAQSDPSCQPGGGTHAPNYEEPKATWLPVSTAPSGLAFYNGDKFPEWSGNLFAGALAGATLWRFVLDANDAVTLREEVAVGQGAGQAHPRGQAGARRLALPAQRRRLAAAPRALSLGAAGALAAAENGVRWLDVRSMRRAMLSQTRSHRP